MIVKLLTENHMASLSLKSFAQACLSQHNHVKIPYCWKSCHSSNMLLQAPLVKESHSINLVGFGSGFGRR